MPIFFFLTVKIGLPLKPRCLKGCMRGKLLADNVVKEAPIHRQDLKKYVSFQLINAMLGFNPNCHHPIENIMV